LTAQRLFSDRGNRTFEEARKLFFDPRQKAQIPRKGEHCRKRKDQEKHHRYDRNDGMLEKAIEYLESGKVVFYAVGLAHLLNDVNGLVDTLQEAGYTVELVTYAG
jgi:uncharacterized protein YbaP (TraB family)